MGAPTNTTTALTDDEKIKLGSALVLLLEHRHKTWKREFDLELIEETFKLALKLNIKKEYENALIMMRKFK